MAETNVNQMIDVNKVVGDTFEDMSIAEMSLVQGSGDMEVMSTPICSFFATMASGIQLVRTVRGNC